MKEVDFIWNDRDSTTSRHPGRTDYPTGHAPDIIGIEISEDSNESQRLNLPADLDEGDEGIAPKYRAIHYHHIFTVIEVKPSCSDDYHAF